MGEDFSEDSGGGSNNDFAVVYGVLFLIFCLVLGCMAFYPGIEHS